MAIHHHENSSVIIVWHFTKDFTKAFMPSSCIWCVVCALCTRAEEWNGNFSIHKKSNEFLHQTRNCAELLSFTRRGHRRVKGARWVIPVIKTKFHRWLREESRKMSAKITILQGKQNCVLCCTGDRRGNFLKISIHDNSCCIYSSVDIQSMWMHSPYGGFFPLYLYIFTFHFLSWT